MRYSIHRISHINANPGFPILHHSQWLHTSTSSMSGFRLYQLWPCYQQTDHIREKGEIITNREDLQPGHWARSQTAATFHSVSRVRQPDLSQDFRAAVNKSVCCTHYSTVTHKAPPQPLPYT